MKEIDRIYIAKYHKKVPLEEIAKSFSSSGTKAKILNEVEEMKKNGTYTIYKDMPEEEWEKLESKSDNYIKDKYYKLAIERRKDLFFKAFEVNIHEIIMSFEKYNYNQKEFNRDYIQEEDYEGEEWKKIGNLNYEISNYGRIKNLTTKKLKKLKYQPYGMQVLLWQNSKSYTITISRLVAEFFIRHLEKDEKAIHINGNSRDNYYKNLMIVKNKNIITKQEYSRRKYEKKM